MKTTTVRINYSIMKRFAFLFCGALILLSYSCSDIISSEKRQSSVDDFSVLTRDLTRSQNEVANTLLNFSINYFKENYSDKSGNTGLSPFSLAMDISMLSLGASGQSYDELTKALGFKGYDSDQIGEFYQTLSGRLKSDNMLSIANAVWFDNNYVENVKPAFREGMIGYFNSEIGSVDFVSAKSADLINGWANSHTAGKIDKIVLPQDLENAVVVLTNAIDFNGEWLNKSFMGERGIFYPVKGESSERDFFKGAGDGIREYNVSCKEKNDPSVIELTIDDRFSVFFLLPPEKLTLKRFVSSLNSADWVRWMISMGPGRSATKVTTFKIPCFQSVTEDDCVRQLMRMGVKSIFDTKTCDLSGIGPGPLAVTSVKQKSAVNMNSEGSSASSATASVISIFTSPGLPQDDTIETQEFLANRPFVYAIVEKSTQTILFMGTVAE